MTKIWIGYKYAMVRVIKIYIVYVIYCQSFDNSRNVIVVLITGMSIHDPMIF